MSVASGPAVPGRGNFGGLSYVPPSLKNVASTWEMTPQPKSSKRSAPAASGDLLSHSEALPSKVASGPRGGIKLSIPNESHYSKHLKEFSDARPEPNDSLWNTALHGNFLVD